MFVCFISSVGYRVFLLLLLSLILFVFISSVRYRAFFIVVVVSDFVVCIYFIALISGVLLLFAVSAVVIIAISFVSFCFCFFFYSFICRLHKQRGLVTGRPDPRPSLLIFPPSLRSTVPRELAPELPDAKTFLFLPCYFQTLIRP